MNDELIRFPTQEEAVKYCEEVEGDFVIELKEPEYADAPFLVLKYEWINDMMVVNDSVLH